VSEISEEKMKKSDVSSRARRAPALLKLSSSQSVSHISARAFEVFLKVSQYLPLHYSPHRRLREPDSTTLWYLQIGPEVEKIR
jgi:hypothetical protein